MKLLKRLKMYSNIIKLLSFIFIIMSLSSCEKKISTQVKEIHWDRDMCTRCVMVVSDRNQTVQVTNPSTHVSIPMNLFDLR